MGPPALLLAGESNRQECPTSVQPPSAIICSPLLRQCPLAMPFGCIGRWTQAFFQTIRYACSTERAMPVFSDKPSAHEKQTRYSLCVVR